MIQILVKWRAQMTLEERAGNGSPAKWTKKQLPKHLMKTFINRGLVAIFPFFGMIIVIVFCILDKPKKKCYGGITEDTADFGMGDVREYRGAGVFCWIYTILWITLSIVGTLVAHRIGSPWAWGNNDSPSESASIFGYIVFASIFCGIAIGQIHAVWTFGCRIWECACPKCYHANTMRFDGEAGSNSFVREELESSTSSGEHRTHTVYVDGKEVGGLYASHSGYDHYVTSKYSDQKKRFKCIHCGHTEIRSGFLEKTKISERYERNNK